MVRCEVCGKEVTEGWVCGMLPSNEKFKLGLCPQHDTPRNRQRVEEHWQQLMEDEIAKSTMRQETESKGHETYAVKIYFVDGGVKTLECTSYTINDSKDLLVLNLDDTADFYPLQHIRHFEVAGFSRKE